LAAETGIAESLINPDLYFNQNVKGTFNVLEQCRKNGVKYLIYASSSSVYEPNLFQMNEESPHNQQLSFYGTSKKMTETMVENYCRQYGMIAIGLRFFTVYGSWTRPDMAAYKFMNAINNDQSIFLYNEGNVYRDFTHVSDIVHSISLLTERIIQEKDGSHKIFNIGYGTPISIIDYAEEIAKKLNKKIVFTSKDLPKNELERTHCDNSKLEKYIKYKPECPLEKGIVEMTDWFKKFKYE
jgi:UDP-glucuronate 4-epimerase